MRGWTGWSAITLAALALVLVIANVALALLNQRTQSEVQVRQQFLVGEPEYRRVGEALVRSLDVAVLSTKDAKLVELMKKHGVSVPTAPAQTQPAPAPKPPGKSR